MNGGQPGGYEAEERQAIQEEARVPDGNGTAAQMVIKRSVSPDGKIDSLSVEFSCPAEDRPGGDAAARAETILRLQSEIVGIFLGQARNGATVPANGNRTYDGAQPGQIFGIGGMNTKWGRRLFLTIQADGQSLKFFGTRKQLAEALTAAGYARMAERIDEGMSLNVPCRVTTKPSEDGRYLNVESLLPPAAGVARRTA